MRAAVWCPLFDAMMSRNSRMLHFPAQEQLVIVSVGGGHTVALMVEVEAGGGCSDSNGRGNPQGSGEGMEGDPLRGTE